MLVKNERWSRKSSATAILILLSISFIPLHALQRQGNGNLGLGNTRNHPVDLRVRVNNDERNAQAVVRALVTLISSNGIVVSEIYTNELGEVVFRNVPQGSYKARVTGIDIETLESSFPFEIDGFQTSHFEGVLVKRKKENAATGQTLVSVAQMNIPESARKEFNKGESAANKRNFESARTHLKAAIELYPKYASAFNMLGLVEMNSKNPLLGIRSFREAIAADDKFTPAFLNLAKARIVQERYADAEDLLMKSLSIQPRDPAAMMFLANAYLLDKKYSPIQEITAQIEVIPHEQFTGIHILNAIAFERQGLKQEAGEEYKRYLKESPNGNQAKMAQEAVHRVSTSQ